MRQMSREAEEDAEAEAVEEEANVYRCTMIGSR
jgi:hypothetical protein